MLDFLDTIEQHWLAGLPIASTTPSHAAEWICRAAASGRLSPAHVHLVNAYSVALADSDGRFKSALKSATFNFPDGKPLGWVARVHRLRLQQIRGPQLFVDVMDKGREYGLTHFLLGATDETLVRLEDELRLRFPGVQIVGSYSPPFRTLSSDELQSQDQMIRESGASIVWVGLGTPKQDFEARRLAAAGNFAAVAVGAAFDFVAGTKKQAPSWMTKVGFEWFFRLATEPRRLWKRYLFGNARFIFASFTVRNRSNNNAKAIIHARSEAIDFSIVSGPESQ